MIVALLKQSLSLELYNDAYEISRIFINDLMNQGYLPVFDALFENLKGDTSMYEIKLTIIERLIPTMSKDQTEVFMKLIESVLGESSDNSIFQNNLNPLRLGLQLYKTIDDV